MEQAETPFIAGFYSVRPADYQSDGLLRISLRAARPLRDRKEAGGK